MPRVLVLLLITATNFGLAYATGIVVARALGVQDFDEFAVAVAAVTMLSTLAEFGTGKYGMKVLPAYAHAGRWGLARGYRRFANRTILTLCIVLGLAFLVPGLLEGDGLTAGTLAVLFLPAMALVGYGAEIVQANRATLRAAVVSRLVVPGTTLLAVVLWRLVVGDLDARTAVGLFGLGWVVGWILVRVFLRQTTPAPYYEAEPRLKTREWLLQVVPFLVFALLVVALAKAGVVVLKRVAPDEEVSVFSAALETGMFLYLIAKSTDKMFLPELSVALEERDVAKMRRERRKRFAWVGAVAGAFLLATILFGKQILGLFGPGFEKGHAALVIVSAGTAVWTLFSLAPSYLKYVDRKRFVVRCTGVAVLANVLLTWWLGSRHGSVGAAIAFAVPVAGLYLTLAAVTSHHLRRLSPATPTGDRSLAAEDAEEAPF